MVLAKVYITQEKENDAIKVLVKVKSILSDDKNIAGVLFNLLNEKVRKLDEIGILFKDKNVDEKFNVTIKF